MTTTMVGEMNYTQTLNPKTLPSLQSPAHQKHDHGWESKRCIHEWKLRMCTWKGHTCMDER